MNHTTQTVWFDEEDITTTVTDMPPVVDDWVCEIRQMGSPLIIGLVCEWRPHLFRPPNKVATLQLCTENKCLIAQLCYMTKIPNSLKSLLNDPNFTFVGVRVGRDARKLRDQYRLMVANAVEIDPLALAEKGRLGSRLDLVNFGLIFCGFQMEKALNLSLRNWVARVLNEEQIKYGCIDACAAYKLGCKLLPED